MELTFHQVFFIGVLIGLFCITGAVLYLAVQIKKHTETTRYNTHITFLGKFLDFNIALGENRDLSDVYQRGLRGLKGLGREEQSQFFSIATYIFNYWNEAYRGARQGDIPEDYWNEARAIIADFVQFPGVRDYWEFRKHWYSIELRHYIDDLIKQTPEKPGPIYPDTET